MRTKTLTPERTADYLAFVESIRERPADNAPRLVSADWWEDYDPDRAEFIRRQVPERAGAGSMLAENGSRWVRNLIPGFASKKEWVCEYPVVVGQFVQGGLRLAVSLRFGRGYVDRVVLDQKDLIRNATELSELVGTCPLESASATAAEPHRFRSLTPPWAGWSLQVEDSTMGWQIPSHRLVRPVFDRLRNGNRDHFGWAVYPSRELAFADMEAATLSLLTDTYRGLTLSPREA